MLRITIGDQEFWDEEKEEFLDIPGDIVLDLEHSLLSLSKWESKYLKAFLSRQKKSNEEIYEYIKFMVITPVDDLDIISKCTQKTIDQIQEYINSPQSATTFGNLPEQRGPSETITAELIYSWMVMLNIPVEFENWHLNRLFSLIRIINMKNSPAKKMSKGEIARRNRDLNARRRAELGTRG